MRVSRSRDISRVTGRSTLRLKKVAFKKSLNNFFVRSFTWQIKVKKKVTYTCQGQQLAAWEREFAAPENTLNKFRIHKSVNSVWRMWSIWPAGLLVSQQVWPMSVPSSDRPTPVCFYWIAGCGVAKVHLGNPVAGDLVSFLGDSAAAPLHLLGGPGQHVPDQVLPEAVVSLSSLRIQYAGIRVTPRS